VKSTRLALIGVPSSAGGRRAGQERGPAALRATGLLDRLAAGGLEVQDLGDLPAVGFHPDPDHPKQRSLSAVLDVARRVGELTDLAVGDGRVPVVLGGDCSLSLGVVAGLLQRIPRLGLVYFDADLDLNTPETSPSGIFDGMVLAHVLGRGVPELADLGPRSPMLSETDIVLFGYDLETSSVDPYEIEVLRESQMSTFPLSSVRRDPTGSARAALRLLEHGLDGFMLHFDIDVTDLPCVDVPHPSGLDPASAFEALNVLAQAPSCVAVVITEFNAELDPDGVYAERLVAGFVRSLGPSRSGAGGQSSVD